MRDFHLPGRSEVYATNGMCATSHPLAAKTAVDILEQGGNAVDAAIAAGLVLGLCEPHLAGLGGDCFALVQPAGQEKIVALNGSAGDSAVALRAQDGEAMPLHGAGEVTVPGAIAGFCDMSEKWGRLDLGTVFASAIRYAEDGVPVAPRTAHDWQLSQAVLQGAAKDFYSLGGHAPVVGQVFRAPGQAEVLRRVANQGARAFYEGEIAADMITGLQAVGGGHTEANFAAANALFGDPASGTYHGTDLVEHSPDSEGLIAILMANILRFLDLTAHDPVDPYRAHLEIEAAKLAYDARNRLWADAGHIAPVEDLLSEATARELADRISLGVTLALPLPAPSETNNGAVYLAVVDRDQMAVSLSYSIFQGFGSGIVSPKYGILMHNRGAGSALNLGRPNELGAVKRLTPASTSAMLRANGRLSTVFGVMGGPYQPTGHVRMMTNWNDFEMGLQAGIDAPRCFADGDVVRIERGYPGAVAQELAAMGQKVIVSDLPLGAAQAIRINYETGVLEGASDPRHDGCALGY